MKISILIIARNEEKNIRKCIESILGQTMTPDEIVVICHNCTDSTETIARSFGTIKVIHYDGLEGVPYARIKGFQEVSGDIVACVDGDSVVDTKWLQNITNPLKDKKITLVAGYVILTNNFFSRLSSFFQFVIMKKFLKFRFNHFAWGSSFACRKRDYDEVGGIAPLVELREKLHLNFWAEDFYLSLALMQRGDMYTALDAKSYTTIPQWKVNPATAPIKQWRADNRALLQYFKSHT